MARQRLAPSSQSSAAATATARRDFRVQMWEMTVWETGSLIKGNKRSDSRGGEEDEGPLSSCGGAVARLQVGRVSKVRQQGTGSPRTEAKT